ncbi:MAG: O-methyltransferase [Bacteroidota bacterium]
MDILNSEINEYLHNVTPERDHVLQEMEMYAKENNFPIVGPLVGRFLYLQARAIGAKRILELGSGFGYSAYWFAKGTEPDCKIYCTDSNPANAERAKTYFRKGKIADKIEFLVAGNALNVIDSLDGSFDIIFNDVSKREYPKVFKKAHSRLRKGGLLISDNALWSGRILTPHPDANIAGILTYNRLVYASRQFFTTIIPLRDGVAVSIKL